MLKNQSTADNVALFLEDVKQDDDIVERFNIPEAGVMSKSSNEARLERDFRPLVEILMIKYKDDAKKAANNKPFLPTTMEEVRREEPGSMRQFSKLYASKKLSFIHLVS